MVGCDATGQSAPHKVRVRPALTDRRSLPRPLRPQQPAGLPGIAQSLREWVGGRWSRATTIQRPTGSGWAFSFSGSAKQRGAATRSACAALRRQVAKGPPGSTLFRPLFSRNPRQLLCGSARKWPCGPVTCTCVTAIGCPSCLDEQGIKPAPQSPPQHRASSTAPGVPAPPRAHDRRRATLRPRACPCRAP